jgi:hypothetical protein
MVTEFQRCVNQKLNKLNTFIKNLKTKDLSI